MRLITEMGKSGRNVTTHKLTLTEYSRTVTSWYIYCLLDFIDSVTPTALTKGDEVAVYGKIKSIEFQYEAVKTA